MIEQGAKANFQLDVDNGNYDCTWEDFHADYKNSYRDHAEVTLEAAFSVAK